MKISRLGEAPDYRFSLANERTFLAWIRTALGFLAAGVGLDQLAPDFATPLIREILALLLCLFAGGRSEERRVGKECKDQCRSRWSPYH